MKSPTYPPIIGFVAYSGSGKTTLLTKLLPILRARELQVGVIKHAHHQFELDTPGKDSYVLRSAGATPVLIASTHRWAMIVDHEASSDPELAACVARMCACATPDLILVEGFKHENFAKIEIHRASLGHSLLCEKDASIIAVATDQRGIAPRGVTELDLNQAGQITDYIMKFYHDTRSAGLT